MLGRARDVPTMTQVWQHLFKGGYLSLWNRAGTWRLKKHTCFTKEDFEDQIDEVQVEGK